MEVKLIRTPNVTVKGVIGGKALSQEQAQTKGAL